MQPFVYKQQKIDSWGIWQFALTYETLITKVSEMGIARNSKLNILSQKCYKKASF